MAKKQVFRLAKDLGVSSSELLEELKEIGIEVKNNFSVLDEEQVELVTAYHEEKRGETLKKLPEAPAGEEPRTDGQPPSAEAEAPAPPRPEAAPGAETKAEVKEEPEKKPTPPPSPPPQREKPTGEPRPPIVAVLGHVDHGKCLHPEERVLLADGRTVPIGSLFDPTEPIERDGEYERIFRPVPVITLDSKERKLQATIALHVWRVRYEGELLEVCLQTGDRLRVTPEHPLLTPRGWRAADRLEVGEEIAVPQRLPIAGGEEALAAFLVERFREDPEVLVSLRAPWHARLQEVVRQGHPLPLSVRHLEVQLRANRFRGPDLPHLAQALGLSDVELYAALERFKYTSPRWRHPHPHPEPESERWLLLPQGELWKDFFYVLGVMFGDGGSGFQRLTCSDPQVRERVSRTLRQLGASPHTFRGPTAWEMPLRGGRTLREFARRCFAFPARQKSRIPAVPTAVELAPRALVGEFLRGYFDADGRVNRRQGWIEVTSASEPFLQGVKTLLLRLGISATLRRKRGQQGSRRGSTTLYLKGKSLERFQEAIGFTVPSKAQALAEIVQRTRKEDPALRPVPLQGREIRRLGWQAGVRPSLPTLGEIAFTPIVALRRIPYRGYVYDLTVPQTDTFVVNNIIAHNTTLLDRIRQTHVAEQEAGGITQSIGAYQAEYKGQKITFIDTPGHRAFTGMRARGAQATDIVVLVVAADDGVMEQTKEAIAHARAAQVPLIVAINKIDRPGADVHRVKQQLAEEGLTPDDWGGETPTVPVSALTGEGVEDLLEMILLVAEMEELRADPKRPAQGIIIESYLDPYKGPVATAILRDGTLREREVVLAGKAYGRIRALLDERGRRLKEAPPGTPVQILGLSEVPPVGTPLEVVKSPSEAKKIAAERAEQERQAKRKKARLTWEDVLARTAKAGVLKLLVKADSVGSLEAVQNELKRLENEEITIEFVHTGVGNVSESDVLLAASSEDDILVLGFRVEVDSPARALAEREGVQVRTYEIIYELADDVRRAIRQRLGPEYEEVPLGVVEVRRLFKIPRVGVVAGCYVRDGVVTRNAHVRVMRGSKEVFRGRIQSLKRFEQDVREVSKDKECGIKIEGFDDLRMGDRLEVFTLREVERI